MYLTEYRTKSLRVPRQDAEVQLALEAQADAYDTGELSESEIESDFETIDNSSATLAESTNQTTARELAAAERTLAIAKDEGADQQAIAEAEAKLEEARLVYQAGTEDLESAPTCCNDSASLSTQSTQLEEAITARQQATADYDEAYKLAISAIRILEDAGVERLEIESPRAAPPSGTTTNITVAGNIYVATKEEVDKIRLYVASNEFIIDVRQPDTAPGNATFVKRVEVEGGPMGITAIAESETSDGSGSSKTVPVGWERVIYDGDGLPIEYERSTTETSTLSNDSDSTATAADEANNGIPDNEEDFDDDGLTTEREFELGTDPVTADTDGDNLSDGFELYFTDTDPLAVDSDQDGVIDGLEDPDGDGLTNVDEEAARTDPLRADSDGDDLLDPDELDVGTDPFAIDTDSDGLLDGTELKPSFKTDPLDPDTDDDGVPDGQETYTTSIINTTLGVSVDLTGPGNVAGDTSISEPPGVIFNKTSLPNTVVSSFADIQPDAPIQYANVSIAYNESEIELGNESTLSLYRFNESQGTYERVNSTVNSGENTVTANVSHFSTYVVFDTLSWENIVNRNPPTRPVGGGTVIEDEPINTTVPQFTIHRDKTDSQNRLLFYLNRSEGSYAYGKVYINNGTFNDYIDSFSTNLDMHHVDGQGDGIPEPGSTTTPDSQDCGDEVYVNKTDQDFNLKQCGSADAWFVSWEATGPTPTINVTLRRTVNVSDSPYIGGSIAKRVQEGEEIPLLSSGIADADDDGIPNYIGNSTYHLAHSNNSVTTEWNNNDTDGDGLEDGNEVLTNKDRVGGGYQWKSNPNKTDTDLDLLSDRVEHEGWNISTKNRTVTYNGTSRDVYRWDKNNETTDSIHVSSDPRSPDTDGDGLRDSLEYDKLHTHPRRNITYGLTLEHQRDIVEGFEPSGLTDSVRLGKSRSIQSIGIADDFESLNELHLTDKTDDFDLVYNQDSSETGQELLTYRSYPSSLNAKGDRRGEYTQRTDTWLNNTEELTVPPREFRTERVWDPDIDNDGLTDGQEEIAMTSVSPSLSRNIDPIVNRRARLNDFDTSPGIADTDGDGYWDGWVGVYNVSYSRNVILYPENLKDGNGIEAGERVDEQVGTHRISEAPTPTGRYAVIGDEKRHSNLHLGELHWETNPTDDGDTADQQTELTFEVDYHAQADSTATDIFSSQGAVHQTYALYGVDIRFVIDDEINNSDLSTIDTRNEARSVEDTYHNQSDSTAYFFITSDWAPGDVEGKASSIGDNSIEGNYGAFLFTAQNEQGTTHNAKTSVHEIGHLLGMGRLDDTPYNLVADIPPVDDADEVYSGGPEDKSPERVELEGRNRILWSAMTSGWNDPVKYDPMQGEYIALSIEEVLELEFEEIDSKDN